MMVMVSEVVVVGMDRLSGFKQTLRYVAKEHPMQWVLMQCMYLFCYRIMFALDWSEEGSESDTEAEK